MHLRTIRALEVIPVSETYSFGSWVLRRRKALDLTRDELARQVGCATETIKKIERDERRPSRQIAELLANALAVPPEEQTLFLQVARGEHSVDRLHSVSKYLSPHPLRLHNLPAQSTSFIGRQDEIADLKARLDDPQIRLLTITGPGGIGKTRLALQVASHLVDTHPGGVWWVELASLSDPTLVPQTIISALGLIEQPGRPPLTVLTEFFQDKDALLVLDNCEHLIQACAELTETLLRACPGLHILATSREALSIPGEMLYLVPSLTTPDPAEIALDTLSQYEAVQLFVDRAQTTMPEFSITQDNAHSIVEVCHQLDGIPLALELAAARVKLLRVEEIAARLDNRFHLLTDGARTALPRHQTLQAMIDWSHDLLSERERVVLRRLSVFAGGWSLEAAESVCTDENIDVHEILDLLRQLVNKSIILSERKQGQKARYRMLEMIRHYAHDKLLASKELELLRDRHLRYFASLAVQISPLLQAPDQVIWLNQLDQELDNLRAALHWSVTANVELGLRLTTALLWFWYTRGQQVEIVSWLKQALAIEDHINEQENSAARILVRAKALSATGFLISYLRTWREEDLETAFLEESIALFRKLEPEAQLDMAFAVRNLGRAAYYRADYDHALALTYESLALYQAACDESGMILCFVMLGRIASDRADYQHAETMFTEGLCLAEARGDTETIADTVGYLADVVFWQGDFKRAIELYEKCLSLSGEVGQMDRVVYVLFLLGEVALAQGDIEGAHKQFEAVQDFAISTGRLHGEACYYTFHGLGMVAQTRNDYASADGLHRKALDVWREQADRWSIAGLLDALAAAAIGQKKLRRAARLIGASEVMYEQMQRALPPLEKLEREHTIEALRDELGPKILAAEIAAGRAMTTEEAITYALEKQDY